MSTLSGGGGGGSEGVGSGRGACGDGDGSKCGGEGGVGSRVGSCSVGRGLDLGGVSVPPCTGEGLDGCGGGVSSRSACCGVFFGEVSLGLFFLARSAILLLIS